MSCGTSTTDFTSFLATIITTEQLRELRAILSTLFTSNISLHCNFIHIIHFSANSRTDVVTPGTTMSGRALKPALSLCPSSARHSRHSSQSRSPLPSPLRNEFTPSPSVSRAEEPQCYFSLPSASQDVNSTKAATRKLGFVPPTPPQPSSAPLLCLVTKPTLTYFQSPQQHPNRRNCFPGAGLSLLRGMGPLKARLRRCLQGES